jgi:5-hydroxyisourate hydrolase
MAADGPTISTHVLDTGTGRPAAGIGVSLTRIGDDGSRREAGDGVTDGDGRIRSVLAGTLEAGVYELTFHLDDRPGTFRRVTLEVRIDDTSRSYHVPLLLAPHGITSYRGS